MRIVYYTTDTLTPKQEEKLESELRTKKFLHENDAIFIIPGANRKEVTVLPEV